MRPAAFTVLVAALLTGVLAIPGLAHDPARTKVTWKGDIERIVHARCVRCHSPDGKGPMSLVTYDDARPYAAAMREEVLARRMPKWHAARGYGAFSNDPSLSAFDIALIVSWADGGALRGEAVPKGGAAGQQTSPPEPPGKDVTIRCGDERLPPGRLLAFRPVLTEGASAGFSVILPGRRQEILGWIRDYEAEFAETYWLRAPLDLPRGSRLRVYGKGQCSVALRLASP
jgi:hypothetical protein